MVDSQKAFKSRFLEEKKKFIEPEHELISFDIKSMYPNINVTRTVSYIITTIFKNPKNFFKQEKYSKGYKLPIPTKEKFKTFLLGVLKDYNIFECQTGTYKQLRGVQMGSSLAPLIAYIFIGCLERSVITKLIKSGDIISWSRYVDDNLAIIKRGSYDKILSEINRWDQHIFYTSEKLVENKLNFLSCTLFIHENKIEFKTYRKSGLDSITSNYQKSVI